MAVVRQVVYNGFIIKFVSINKFNMMMMFLSILQQDKNTLIQQRKRGTGRATNRINWMEWV